MTELANGRDVVASTAQPHKSSSGKKPSARTLETIELGKRLTPWISGFLKASLVPFVKDLRSRIVTLERDNLALQHRLGAAEAQLADRSDTVKIRSKLIEIEDALAHAMSYQGPWTKGRLYQRGAAVTFDGGLWLCVASTDLKPGSGNEWRLTVKSGSMR